MHAPEQIELFGMYMSKITLYNVCSTVGMFSTMGDIIMHVGDILSTMGKVQYRGGCHDKCGGYLEYRGDSQYHGGYHDALGGYHQYRVGNIFCYLSTPTVLHLPHVS